MKYIACFFIFLVMASGAVTFPALAEELVDIAVENQQETITLHIKQATRHKVFTLPSPDRLVIDVPAGSGKARAALPSSYDGGLIKGVRFGRFDPHTSRFVFDLNQPVRVSDTREEEGSLVIVIAPGEGEAVSPPPAAETPEASPPLKEKPRKHSRSKAKKPEKPLIVIDPGHGGVDPGTAGADGAFEKDIVLEYGRALKAKLLKSGHYRVKLTRDDDRFIMLRQRVAIARKAGASLFISLHADSAPDDAARGLSVYTVSEKASDQEAEALAARENKADVLAGMDLSDERDDVAGILISLAQRDTKNRSAEFADFLVTRLEDKVRLLPNTHRFAGFAVLKAPDIPSVLIEIGFLSYPAEEKLLESKAYREKVTTGIAAGVEAYFKRAKILEER